MPPKRSPRPRNHDRPPRRHKHHKDEIEDDDLSPTYILSKVLRAFLGRLLFVIHSLLTIWQSVQVYQNQTYWSFSLISVAILIEGGFTIVQRAGDERKWFCPSVLLYVMATTPSIWLLELDLSRKRYIAITKNGTIPVESIGEVEATLKVPHELWIQILEQFMLVILIVGRWLLPKGEITREQLSQILLAYLAIASDIVEMFDVFKEPPVTIHAHLRYLVLLVWSLSLVQFGFVLTTSKARKMRIALTSSSGDDEMKRMHNRLTGDPTSTVVEILKDSDIWAIVLANALQDVPFLIVRLYLMIGYDIITYTMIFFTCKNFLIIALQSYRLIILINDRYLKFEPEEDARKLYKHYKTTLGACRMNLQELKESHPYLVPQKSPRQEPVEPEERIPPKGKRRRSSSIKYELTVPASHMEEESPRRRHKGTKGPPRNNKEAASPRPRSSITSSSPRPREEKVRERDRIPSQSKGRRRGSRSFDNSANIQVRKTSPIPRSNHKRKETTMTVKPKKRGSYSLESTYSL